ncbi:MAG: hypothetical protein P8I00_04955 [Methylophilaceae bacterium]|nr:hypothetical protein [Methylophilaceae bacterium]
MEEWLEGEVVKNVKWTKNLASLKIKAKINNHQAGQFTRIGLKVNDDFITRSYSYASAPKDEILEIIYVNIPNGKCVLKKESYFGCFHCIDWPACWNGL